MGTKSKSSKLDTREHQPALCQESVCGAIHGVCRIHKSLLIDVIYKLKSYIRINDWIYLKGRVIIHLQDIIVNGFTTIFPSRKSFESACSEDFFCLACRTGQLCLKKARSDRSPTNASYYLQNQFRRP